LKDASAVWEKCCEEDEQICVTKNGCGVMILVGLWNYRFVKI